MEEFINFIIKSIDTDTIEKIKKMPTEIKDEFVNLFKTRTKPSYNNSGGCLYLFGIYYEARNEYLHMYRYYLMAFQKKYLPAYHKLHEIELSFKNYQQAETYLLLGVEETDNESMLLYAMFCQRIEKSIESAIEWYKKAIEHGNIEAICRLGELYEFDKKDKDTSLTYYFMALNAGYKPIYTRLAEYYAAHETDYNTVEKYYLLAQKNGVEDAYLSLANYYKNKNQNEKAIEYYKIHYAEPNKINLEKLHKIFKSIGFESEFYKYLEEKLNK
jgi:TPR repeat protein